ncbi:MAG TPA: hypothetical protein VKR23_01420 [Gaiellaceae bacterium]|nr:hypothetical protein [Gaiellaceae bacterium]
MSARDRWFLGLAAVAVAVFTPVAVLLSGHRQATPPGCRTEIVAGFMGGETHTVCGAPHRR